MQVPPLRHGLDSHSLISTSHNVPDITTIRLVNPHYYYYYYYYYYYNYYCYCYCYCYNYNYNYYYYY